MAAASSVRELYIKTETNVAVLQVQVSNIEKNLEEVKQDIKQLHNEGRAIAQHTQELLNDMSERAERAHDDLNKKIGALEKWRWMMMGAGIVLGSTGFELIGSLLK